MQILHSSQKFNCGHGLCRFLTVAKRFAQNFAILWKDFGLSSCHHSWAVWLYSNSLRCFLIARNIKEPIHSCTVFNFILNISALLIKFKKRNMWINSKIFPLEFVLNQYEIYYPIFLCWSCFLPRYWNFEYRAHHICIELQAVLNSWRRTSLKEQNWCRSFDRFWIMLILPPSN